MHEKNYLRNRIKIAIEKNISNIPITIKEILIRFVIVVIFEFERFETLLTEEDSEEEVVVLELDSIDEVLSEEIFSKSIP